MRRAQHLSGTRGAARAIGRIRPHTDLVRVVITLMLVVLLCAGVQRFIALVQGG
jgi:hypothetical protein